MSCSHTWDHHLALRSATSSFHHSIWYHPVEGCPVIANLDRPSKELSFKRLCVGSMQRIQVHEPRFKTFLQVIIRYWKQIKLERKCDIPSQPSSVSPLNAFKRSRLFGKWRDHAGGFLFEPRERAEATTLATIAIIGRELTQDSGGYSVPVLHVTSWTVGSFLSCSFWPSTVVTYQICALHQSQ